MANGNGGNFLTRDLGPVPGYVWVFGGVAALLLYRTYAQSKTGATSSSSSTAAAQQAQLAQAQQQQLLASEQASAYYPTYQGQQTPIYLINLAGATTPGGQATGTASGTPTATTPASTTATTTPSNIQQVTATAIPVTTTPPG